MEKDVEGLRSELYREYEPHRQELPPIDLNNCEVAPAERSPPPPAGELVRPPLTAGTRVLAMRHHLLQVWKEAVIEEEQVTRTDVKEFKVKFEGKVMRTVGLTTTNLCICRSSGK